MQWDVIISLSTIFIDGDFFPFKDSQDITKDTQKKSKRKGRNKQEVIAVSQTEPEPEAVKTPIDLMRVSIHNRPKR